MLNTGTRTGELLNLQWEWERKIEDTGLSVFVLPGEFAKSGKARIIILNSIAQRILESNRGNQSTHVFTYRGKPWKGAKLTNSAWKSARKRAGLQHVRVHDLRHTYGARLRAAGVSHEDRQDLLGHESGSMTTHYSAASIQRLQSEAEKVIGSDPLLLDRQASWMGQKRGSSALVVGSAG
jgi:integrase